MHQSESGAFTGEISADMLQNIGVNIVILGHSERRAIFNDETDIDRKQSKYCFRARHDCDFCFGEELKDRQSANHFNVVENQLKDGLFNIQASDWGNVVLHMSQYILNR
jgi:triosephosphate isomerase